MIVTLREIFAVLHGFIFGGTFLLAFSGGIYALLTMRPNWLTTEGLETRVSQLKIWNWVMAAAAWLTVILGTFLVYPWYRLKPPEGTTDLTAFPRYFLLANETTAMWHEFGMEWKEHVGWIAPIAATVVAYIFWVYGAQLTKEPKIRKALTWFFIIAFGTAVVAGVLGAFITKMAPVR